MLSEPEQCLLGSPGFQSPEQLKSESVGPPSDVYAFGGLMLVVITENPLWPGLNHFSNHANNQYPCTEGLATGLKEICSDCFSTESLRPAVCEVLRRLLAVCGAD